MRKPWTITDFVVVWLAGVAGSAAAVPIAQALDVVDHALLLVILTGQFTGVLLSFWLLSRRKDDPGVGLSVEPKDLRYLGLGILLQIASALLINPLSRVVYPEGRPPQEIADAMADPAAPMAFKLTLFSTAVILAPLTEEIMFRGVLFKALIRRGRRLALWVTALVFTAVHVFGLDPGNMAGSAAIALPPILILGLVLAWITDRSGRLGPAIFLHSGWNLLAALILLIPPELLDQAGGG